MARSNSKLVEAVDKLILETLAAHNWGVTKTAAHLHCSVRTVRNHVARLSRAGQSIPLYNPFILQNADGTHKSKCDCHKCEQVLKITPLAPTVPIVKTDYCSKCGRTKSDKLIYANGACSRCVEVFKVSAPPLSDARCVICGKWAKTMLIVNHLPYCVGCRLDKHHAR